MFRKQKRSLAGLRIGLSIGQPELIEALERVKNSFNSYPHHRLAIAGAIASYEDEACFQKSWSAIIKNRKVLVQGMRALGFNVLPSTANFIFTCIHLMTLAAGLPNAPLSCATSTSRASANIYASASPICPNALHWSMHLQH